MLLLAPILILQSRQRFPCGRAAFRLVFVRSV